MLVPLTRQKFEQLIPLVATGSQYAFYWGKSSVFLRRILISILAVVAIVLVGLVLGEWFDGLKLILSLIAILYWLWAPVYLSSLRNAAMRRYKYSGFWQGEVLDVFVTEELIGTEETVSKRGQLIIIENRERRLNLEVGDDTGFTANIQVPLRKTHKAIAIGQIAEMMVLSNFSDLSSIVKTSDIYIPSQDIWVSDYPFLQRELFSQVSRQLREEGETPTRRDQPKAGGFANRPRSSKFKRRRRDY